MSFKFNAAQAESLVTVTCIWQVKWFVFRSKSVFYLKVSLLLQKRLRMQDKRWRWGEHDSVTGCVTFCSQAPQPSRKHSKQVRPMTAFKHEMMLPHSLTERRENTQKSTCKLKQLSYKPLALQKSMYEYN